MKLPAWLWLVGVGLILVVWMQRESFQRGVIAQQAAQYDSLHTALTTSADSLATVASRSRLTADSLRRLFRAEQSRDARDAVRADSVLRTVAEARMSAETILQDSLASLTTTKAALADVIRASRVADSTAAHQLAGLRTTLRAAQSVVQADSLALQDGLSALRASQARALSAENQVLALRASRPSALGNVLRSGVWLAAGVGIGRLVR